MRHSCSRCDILLPPYFKLNPRDFLTLDLRSRGDGGCERVFVRMAVFPPLRSVGGGAITRKVMQAIQGD